MKVLVFGAYSEGDPDPSVIHEDVCVDGTYHATRVVVTWDFGPCLTGDEVARYRDLRPCDGSCGISTLPEHEQEMLEVLIALEEAVQA